VWEGGGVLVEGGGVYTTLMESDVVESNGHSEGVTGSGRTHKTPKDLSSCESEVWTPTVGREGVCIVHCILL